MTSSASTRVRRPMGSLSLFGLIKVLGRLTPRQISDEFSIAVTELKQKGIKAGVAAAFLVVALVFALFFAVALVVAAIMGLAELMSAWLAALLVALLFLVIAGVLALIGVSRFRKQLPLLPEKAIYGVRYDLGVLREGRSFDPATLDVKKSKDDKDKDGKDSDDRDSTPKEPRPSYEELRGRTGERREHMAEARDSLGAKADVKTRLEKARHRSSQPRPARGATRASRSDEVAAVSVRRVVSHNTSIADRWKPLSVLTASVAAMIVMLRRLLTK
ncbi:phage holin family protein [Arthrobacter echini]|nr:phage holin family protein [Arthrobacter echini]